MGRRIMCILIFLLLLAERTTNDFHATVTVVSVTQGRLNCITDLEKASPAHASTVWNGLYHAKTIDRAQDAT